MTVCACCGLEVRGTYTFLCDEHWRAVPPQKARAYERAANAHREAVNANRRAGGPGLGLPEVERLWTTYAAAKEAAILATGLQRRL